MPLLAPQVLFGGGKYTAFVTNRMQRNLDSGQERMLLRGTWYFQRPDGNLSPFPEDIAGMPTPHCSHHLPAALCMYPKLILGGLRPDDQPTPHLDRDTHDVGFHERAGPCWSACP